MVSEILGLLRSEVGGACPRGIPGQCHLMGLKEQ